MAKTYYTVPDKAAGDTFTEAMWDNYLKTNINNLRVPASVDAYTTATMALSTGVQDSLNLAAEAYDTDSMYTPGNDYITINTAGIYALTVAGACQSSVTFEMWISASTGAVLAYSQTVAGVRCCGNAIQSLAAGVTLTPYVKATSGANTLETSAYIHAHWLGQTS